MIKTSSVEDFSAEVKRLLPFEANTDQLLAIKQISNFILGPESRSVFILRGYAGTGKTNLISAFTKALPGIKKRSVLLAPTGRAAKVLSSYAQRPAQTIHKKIFKKDMNAEGGMTFLLADNLHRNTIFIVDEASMISADSGGENLFNSLLENLFEYVYSGDNCKLILIGDTAQLPPVGSVESPALHHDYLRSAFHLNISGIELKEVARQRLESGILYNATSLRNEIIQESTGFPQLVCSPDFVNLPGDELEDRINSAISKYGEENVVIITRSNKRANLYNQSFRNRIKLYEEDLCTGDKIMIVKNNYFWLPAQNKEAGFIANGDMVEITRITKRESTYGFNFCDCHIRFVDYPEMPELQVKLLIDSLFTDSPALTQDEQKKLYTAVLEDVQGEPNRYLRSAYIRENPYFNALQVKFSYAITCHKSQGGQWPVVFIDQGFLKEEDVDQGFLRWLYTAITRATEQVYLLNFNPAFFE